MKIVRHASQKDYTASTACKPLVPRSGYIVGIQLGTAWNAAAQGSDDGKTEKPKEGSKGGKRL